jgi:hypothetical protein
MGDGLNILLKGERRTVLLLCMIIKELLYDKKDAVCIQRKRLNWLNREVLMMLKVEDRRLWGCPWRCTFFYFCIFIKLFIFV